MRNVSFAPHSSNSIVIYDVNGGEYVSDVDEQLSLASKALYKALGVSVAKAQQYYCARDPMLLAPSDAATLDEFFQFVQENIRWFFSADERPLGSRSGNHTWSFINLNTGACVSLTFCVL